MAQITNLCYNWEVVGPPWSTDAKRKRYITELEGAIQTAVCSGLLASLLPCVQFPQYIHPVKLCLLPISNRTY